MNAIVSKNDQTKKRYEAYAVVRLKKETKKKARQAKIKVRTNKKMKCLANISENQANLGGATNRIANVLEKSLGLQKKSISFYGRKGLKPSLRT